MPLRSNLPRGPLGRAAGSGRPKKLMQARVLILKCGFSTTTAWSFQARPVWWSPKNLRTIKRNSPCPFWRLPASTADTPPICSKSCVKQDSSTTPPSAVTQAAGVPSFPEELPMTVTAAFRGAVSLNAGFTPQRNCLRHRTKQKENR